MLRIWILDLTSLSKQREQSMKSFVRNMGFGHYHCEIIPQTVLDMPVRLLDAYGSSLLRRQRSPVGPEVPVNLDLEYRVELEGALTTGVMLVRNKKF